MNYQSFIRQLYQDFNARHVDAVLAHLHTDVAWPNGWEGGYVTGHDSVRAYWLRQWQQIDPTVEPLAVDVRADGSVVVKVRQIIRGLTGQLVSDTQLNHVYHIDTGKVRTMVIERD